MELGLKKRKYILSTKIHSQTVNLNLQFWMPSSLQCVMPPAASIAHRD
jgi:hypothetical protein